jgi:hypothetical protein
VPNVSVDSPLSEQTDLQTSLVGTWDAQKTAAKETNPKWLTPKTSRFLLYTFHLNGTWTRTIDRADGKPQQAQGTFSISGDNLVMTNDDGSKPLEWKIEFSNNDQELNVEAGILLMKLIRLPFAPR